MSCSRFASADGRCGSGTCSAGLCVYSIVRRGGMLCWSFVKSVCCDYLGAVSGWPCFGLRDVRIRTARQNCTGSSTELCAGHVFGPEPHFQNLLGRIKLEELPLISSAGLYVKLAATMFLKHMPWGRSEGGSV
jgi:hypothetical protein